MLGRAAVEEFLGCRPKELELEIPGNIKRDALAEAFCQYVEDDYYQWLKGNCRSFFGDGEVDWELVRGRTGA